MKRNEAADVVEMLIARWPGSRWSSATMEAYIGALEPLDATVAVAAVLRAQNELDYAPSIKTLREFYGIERRLAESEPPIERMLNSTPSQIMPAWVKGWACSRVHHRDFRVWPEQDVDGEPMPREDQEKYTVEGATMTIEDMFSGIGAPL